VLSTRAAAHHFSDFVSALIQAVDGDVVSQAANSRGQLNVLARDGPRDALSIPAFVYLGKSLTY
jgi:hypothetical protein